MKFKFDVGDTVKHSVYGTGLVLGRCLSASGVNELYELYCVGAFLNHGFIHCKGDDLTLVSRSEGKEDKS